MKRFEKLLKNGLVTLFLVCSVPAFAQIVAPSPVTPIGIPGDLTVGSITNNTLPVTTINDAVLFYNPATSGPSLTLTASLDDGLGNTFTAYQWHTIITTDGTTETENLITGEATQNLTLTQLTPGYHKYRVYGLVDDGSVICQSGDFEDIILFVLSPLTVETTFNANGNPLAYCSTDVPATPIELSVTSLNVDYTANTNGYPNPDGNDFEVTYTWFAVKDADTANPIDLATSADTYAVTLTDPGTYTFYVEVEYVVKDKGSRDYVTYTTTVQDGAADLQIVVSPTPGAPTITIGTVTD
ncbi:hypothetical protein [Sinomicrobium weinanense]|uniref:Uncharacterized protein n=1 Tax=Sinomicrobium weinanense TaxID=2842200 RepID=A0A926JU45_9FLAO|nr:hypothetical protein [Sinomicrobium weinanense]MBC9797354.1 hypothetical protein [Sinomicrobium weinanense]MBU3123415.1 hypothetical protein [Sinomicrobium weinanense]